MKKVVILQGSPRKEGYCAQICQVMMQGLEPLQVTVLDVCDQNIAPCNACDACAHSRGCILSDDMQKVYDLLSSADAIVLASPLYFGGISAHLKALVDRCQAIYNGKIHGHPMMDNKKRSGLFICTAGAPNADFPGAKMTAQWFFKCLDATVQAEILVHNTDCAPKIDGAAIQQIAKQWLCALD